MNSYQNKAVIIADKTLKSIKITPGQTERGVACSIREQLKKEGADKEAFRIIVASGRRSRKIHGFATGKVIRRKDVVIVDIGALYKGFRSDITRTYILGKPTRLQRKIYRLLLKAQKAALKKVKAGVECREVDTAARSVIRRAGFGNFFKHTTGHGIGRKTHEAPRISRKNRNKLRAGQVITIEPGIYLKNWGMRIEDMVMVTNRGYKLLTKAPK